MIRLDRQRLQGATFPERMEIATRIADLDVQGHVNNVAVATILQESRGRFNKARVASLLGPGDGMVVGGLFIEYAGQMYFPEPLEVSIGALEIGRSSYALGQIVRQDGRITAYAEVSMVIIREGRAAPLSDTLRAALEAASIVPAAHQL